MQGTVSEGLAPALNLFTDQGKRVNTHRIWIRHPVVLLGGQQGQSVWRHQGRLPGRKGIQALKDRKESAKQRWGHALEGGEAHTTGGLREHGRSQLLGCAVGRVAGRGQGTVWGRGLRR